MDCLASNPWAGSTDPTKSGLSSSYQWACGQCQSIPTDESTNPGAARAQCKACIASPTAQALYPGILTAGELGGPGPARDNDFGRCVYFANQTYLINTNSLEIKGIYDSCKAGLPTLSKLDCMQVRSDGSPPASLLFPSMLVASLPIVPFLTHPPLPASSPAQCMFAAEQGAANSNTGYNLQASPSKDWACASYCQVRGLTLMWLGGS